nr:PAS domain-containing protein [Natronolimnobius sp. AArcel1]
MAFEQADESRLEICEAIRARDQACPVIVVGEQPQAAVGAVLFDVDATAYVRRDAPTETLVETCRSAVDQYRRCRDATRVAKAGGAGQCLVRDGILTYVTPSLGKLFGTDPAALEGSPFTDLITPAHRDRVANELATVEQPREMQFSVAADDGGRRTFHVQWRPAGEELVGTVIEDTERTRRIQSLERDAAMLESLLEHLPISIYFKDRASRHERVSEYMTKNNPEAFIENNEGKIHPHAEDLIGKTDFDLYATALAEEAIEDDRTVIDNEATITGRIEATRTGTGQELYTSTTKAPWYDTDGRVAGVVGVTLDITDRVTSRKELERHNERLSEFAEVLTHDLRNPVNVAQGYIDVLQTEYDREAIDACERSLERISRLIDEIREFVLQGRSVESPEPVGLRAVARQAWKTVDTKDATLEVETTRRVYADPERLQRLLENLFRNAIEHGLPDHHSSDARNEADNTAADPSLTVRLEWTGTGFAVVDDGSGLSESGDELELLFERGYTTARTGTGFGLSIVRDIANAHGWSVSAATGTDGGARFEFENVVVVDEDIGQTYGL